MNKQLESLAVSLSGHDIYLASLFNANDEMNIEKLRNL